MTETEVRQRSFFLHLFPNRIGYLCIAIIDPTVGKTEGFSQQFFRFPDDVNNAIAFIQSKFPSCNVYFCAQILDAPERTKANVTYCSSAWADLDYCPPEKLLVQPSITVESSPGKYHGYWFLEEPLPAEDVEFLCKRIAYRHKDDGCDVSGWDLTQILRVPFTYNFKYTPPSEIKVVKTTTAKYRIDDFQDYPEAPGLPSEREIKYELPQVPTDISGNDVLKKYESILTTMVHELFETTPNDGRPEGWSGALWALELALLEFDISEEEVFIICRDSACNKYARDNRSQLLLWREVQKASQHVAAKRSIQNTYRKLQSLNDELLSNAERESIRGKPTIVDRYAAWAARQTDAASQYHLAGGFMILSSLLAGHVQIPLSYGTIRPNLWFMILGDTTLTRKTTAMRLAVKVLEEVNKEAMLATDGSIEGIFFAMGQRPGESSMYWKDEVSGMMEVMAKKDYMAGMQQELLKLYDGDTVRRRLRSGDQLIENPVFILYAGGIKQRLLEIFTERHIESGFLPRFVFCIADPDRSKLKRVGLAATEDRRERDILVDELATLNAVYDRTNYQTIAGVSVPQRHIFNIVPTYEALERWNDFGDMLLTDSERSGQPDLFTPMFQRLADSTLKAAALLSLARQREISAAIELEDIYQAIRYAEEWRDWAAYVIRNIGSMEYEIPLAKIVDSVKRNPGITRTELMRKHHLDARIGKLYFDSLEQRGEIKFVRTADGLLAYPMT